jgi:hypothetical protein
MKADKLKKIKLNQKKMMKFEGLEKLLAIVRIMKN